MRPATSEELDSFVSFCSNEFGWKLSWENHDKSVKVWEQCHSNGVKAVRVQAYYPDVDPNVLYDTIHDSAYRQVWDENVIEEHVVEQIDETNEVCYYAARIIGFKSRDFVTKRSWRVKDDREFVIVSSSVPHSNAPEKHGFVRAHTHVTGYLIQRADRGCFLTFITQTDLKGMLPSCVTKWVAPSVIHKLGEASRKYMEWKSQHNPEHKPWRGTNKTQNVPPVGYYYQTLSHRIW